MRKYVIGVLLDPRPDDAVYGSVEEARKWARQWASQDHKVPIAVWRREDRRNDLVCVFLAMEQLVPTQF